MSFACFGRELDHGDRGIMPGRKGHFSGGHFISCSVSYLHGLVGKRTVVPQKHRISQNYSIKNMTTHFFLDRGWSQDSKESHETPYLV